MLYNALIVDDEEIIREGLKQFIDWKRIGYQLVTAVSDGKDAIEYISKNPVDLVLTDVKMTYVSGVELAKFIYEYHPNIKVMFLSAYSDFNYAVDAMKYDAEDYILKTASSEEIENALSKVKSKLDKYYKEKRNKSKLETSSDLLPYLKEQFLTNLITGVITDKSLVYDFLSLVELDTAFADYQATLCIIEAPCLEVSHEHSWKYGKDGFYNVIRNFFDKQHLEKKLACICSFGKKTRVLFMHNSNIDLNSFEKKFYDLFKLKISIKIESSFEKLEHMLNVKQFKVSSSNIKETISSNDMEQLTQQFENLVSLINSEEVNDANNLFIAIINQFGDVTPQNLKEFISDFLYNIRDKLTYNNFADNFINDKTVLKSVSDLKNVWLSSIKSIENYTEKTDNYLITKALQYIENNICNDITLEDTAQSVYLSPAYFSRLFKKHYDLNFKDYVVNLKMEKAMQLLKNPEYKIYEISEILGYKSVRFFSQTFKKHTGKMPSEFRQFKRGE